MIAAVPLLADAQIQPGRTYAGGEVISDPELGLRLTLPRGWRGLLAPDGSSFRLSPDSGTGYIVVLAEEMTEAEARRQMANPIDLGDGVVLRPQGAISEVASGHFSATYTVSGAPSRLDGSIDVRLARGGLGVAFILLSPPDASEAHRIIMREFAFSLGLAATPARPAPESAQSGNDAWEPFLRGLYMARYFTRTGYTDSTELWLCSDGTFRYRSLGGGFGGGASGAFQGTANGRWTATGVGKTGSLVLESSAGSRMTLALSYDYELNRVMVNGERWLRGRNEVCS